MRFHGLHGIIEDTPENRYIMTNLPLTCEIPWSLDCLDVDTPDETPDPPAKINLKSIETWTRRNF